MADRVERRITEKASYVRDALEVLVEKRDALDFEAYQSDREQRDVVEREFETAIEACIDIGEIVLTDAGRTVPDANAEVFRELRSIGILDTDTARRMAEAAGFRNILSHRYGDAINDEDVYNFLAEDLPLFHAFLDQIGAYLRERDGH
jgi:uncharacterized protein YutE (UPF0331/DUF86 family)